MSESERYNLYQDLVDAGIETDHNASDLQFPVTEVSLALYRASAYKNGQLFISEVDSMVWMEVPFAYTPFWVRVAETSKV